MVKLLTADDQNLNATKVKVAAMNKSADNQTSHLSQNLSNCDSSSGISSSSATSLQQRTSNSVGGANGDGFGGGENQQHYHQLWLDDIPSKGMKGLDIGCSDSKVTYDPYEMRNSTTGGLDSTEKKELSDIVTNGNQNPAGHDTKNGEGKFRQIVKDCGGECN